MKHLGSSDSKDSQIEDRGIPKEGVLVNKEQKRADVEADKQCWVQQVGMLSTLKEGKIISRQKYNSGTRVVEHPCEIFVVYNWQ
jgi:hypothetical protein